MFSLPSVSKITQNTDKIYMTFSGGNGNKKLADPGFFFTFFNMAFFDIFLIFLYVAKQPWQMSCMCLSSWLVL